MSHGLHPTVGRGSPCPDVLTWCLGPVHLLPTQQGEVQVADRIRVAVEMTSKLGWPFWIIRGEQSTHKLSVYSLALLRHGLTLVALAGLDSNCSPGCLQNHSNAPCSASCVWGYSQESPHLMWLFQFWFIYFAVCTWVPPMGTRGQFSKFSALSVHLWTGSSTHWAISLAQGS